MAVRRTPKWWGRSASRRVVFTIADQALSSVSNFAVGVAVARLAGAASLGAFALAYTLWLLLAGCHRSLITEPLIVYGDGISGSSADLREGLAVEIALGAVASLLCAGVGAVLLLLGQHSFAVALLLLAPWLVPLLVQDFWRWAGFMWGRPGRSLLNDLLFNLVQATVMLPLLLMGHRSVAVPITAWGAGGAAGALLGLWQFSVRPTAPRAKTFLQERWAISRWLLAQFATGWASGQAYLVLAGAVLGPAALGGLRAAQTLMAPSSVLATAAGSLGLPEASRAFCDTGWKGLERVAHRMAVACMVGVGAIGVIVLAAAPHLLQLLYGPGFAQFAPAARVYAAALILLSLVGPAETVVTVTRMTRSLLTPRLANVALTLTALLVLGPRFGVTGAACAYALGIAVHAAVFARVYRRVKRRFATLDEDAASDSTSLTPQRSA